MFISYLSLIPEILLLMNIVILQIVKICRKEQTPKTFASISKALWILTLIGSIIFYNVIFDENWYINTEYTTFIKAVLLMIILLMNSLVCRWFLNQNYSSCRYYQIISLILIGLFGIISCRHLGLLAVFLSVVFIAVAIISDIGIDNVTEKIKQREMSIINSLITITFAVVGVIIIYERTNILQYNLLQNYYQKNVVNDLDKLGMILILTSILSLIGSVPFHFERLKIQRESILPVASMLSIVLPLTGIAFLLKNLAQIFGSDIQIFNQMILICGIASVGVGAIGSGCGNNLRRILGCLEIFNTGIVLLLFYSFHNMNSEVVFIYTLIFSLILIGVYTCLYGARSRGNYVQTLEDFTGLAEVKPYLAGFLLIFICSFLGLPPFLSVLGNILMVKIMLTGKHFICLGIVFLSLIWVAYGILKVIKSLYFDKRGKNFERVDACVYVGIILTLILMLYGLSQSKSIIDNIAIIMRK